MKWLFCVDTENELLDNEYRTLLWRLDEMSSRGYKIEFHSLNKIIIKGRAISDALDMYSLIENTLNMMAVRHKIAWEGLKDE